MVKRYCVLLFLSSACQTTSRPVAQAAPATAATLRGMEDLLESPGTLEVTRVVSADWVAPLSGLLNLKHPRAAGLSDREEPIHLYYYEVKHPTQGSVLIDTGFAPAADDAFNWLLKRAMNIDKRVIRTPPPPAPTAIFLTHLHLDHITGLPAIASAVPVFVGPGDATLSNFVNAFTQGTYDTVIGGHPLNELSYSQDGVRDVFGDAMLFALHLPGHTPGSSAYFARTTTGPVLITGDVSHTLWGWDHDVGPGEFCVDTAQAEKSFLRLRDIAKRHPQLTVYLGHQ